MSPVLVGPPISSVLPPGRWSTSGLAAKIEKSARSAQSISSGRPRTSSAPYPKIAPAPAFHTRGATKFYSAACFEAIGVLKSGLGWDTIDEAHAMMLGFRTRSFAHLRAFHHRPQGGGIGFWRGRLATGRSAYQIGYSPIFVCLGALDLIGALVLWTLVREPVNKVEVVAV